MRHSALNAEQRYEDILKGLPILTLVVLTLFLFKTIGINPASKADSPYGNVFLEIEGEVTHPGIYSFNHPPDIRELIEKGGGIGSDAIDKTILKNVPLHSGSKITVQKDKGKWIVTSEEISSFHRITLGMPISINRETEEGLTAIPGIGPTLAGSIAKEKIKRGGFKTLEELKSVRGIGDKTYEKILPYIEL